MSETYTPPRYVPATEQAKMLRAALKAEFPGAKFSVRCSRGSAIDVRWTDGPTQPAVQTVCDRYRGGGFDGMQDLRYSVETLLTTADGAERVQFCADFVMAQRELSSSFRAGIVGEVLKLAGITAPDLRDSEVNRWMAETRVPVHVDRDGIAYRIDGMSEYLSDVVHRVAWHRKGA